MILAFAAVLAAGASPLSRGMDAMRPAPEGATTVTHQTRPTWDQMVDESLALVADSVTTVSEHIKRQDKKNDPLVFVKATGDRVHVAYASERPEAIGANAVGIRFVAYLPTKYHVNKASSGFEPGKDVDLVAILTLRTSYAFDEGASSARIGIEELSLEGLWPTDPEGRSRQATHLAELAAALKASRE
jgi:hypothetical protein